MHASNTAARPGPAPWTCPFCALLCDGFDVEARAGAPLTLVGSDCPRARGALAHFDGPVGVPQVNGQDCDLDTALAAAATLLAASRQPLFGGLATDVAGGRALYALACATGAICDAAGGASQMHGLRALQDRGGFSTTLAEVKTRADLVVCMTEGLGAQHPELWRRFGVGEREDLAVATLPLHGDLFDTVSLLAALVAGRIPPQDLPDLAALATRLQAARYAVLAYEPARLPPQGALIVEAIGRIVGTLNRSTRAASLALGGHAGAASLALGGHAGAATVNQVVTWLSGLPLRSRAGPRGLEHEPLCFDAPRLLADGAVDLLLWVASDGPEPAPPPAGVPTIVLGHSSLRAAQAAVFIPVATPGIHTAGHLFRTDGSVLLPLRAVRDDGLPGVADVVRRLTRAVQEAKS